MHLAMHPTENPVGITDLPSPRPALCPPPHPPFPKSWTENRLAPFPLPASHFQPMTDSSSEVPSSQTSWSMWLPWQQLSSSLLFPGLSRQVDMLTSFPPGVPCTFVSVSFLSSLFPSTGQLGRDSQLWLAVSTTPSLLHLSLQHPAAAALRPLKWLDEAFRRQGPFSSHLLHPSRASDAGDLFWCLDLLYFFDSHFLGHTSSVSFAASSASAQPAPMAPEPHPPSSRCSVPILWVFSLEGLGNRPYADQAQRPSLSCPELF